MEIEPWAAQTRKLQPWLMFTMDECCSAPLCRHLSIVSDHFSPISLDQMDGVALLNRIDTKFAMTNEQLISVLENLRDDYWMLEVDGHRLNHYRTLYFDTPDFDLYHAHVNGRPERYKVRSRVYADSNLTYLEMKHRTRKDRTIKERIPIDAPVTRMTADMNAWLRSVAPLDGGSLEPKLHNTFTRMTLVNKHNCERVTLDIDLAYFTDHSLVHLDGIAVAEVKMDAAGGDSPFLVQMRTHRIHQHGFSKYTVGVAILYDGVKKNEMKPRLLWISKTMKGTRTDERNEHFPVGVCL
jgi:hypothetical protein